MLESRPIDRKIVQQARADFIIQNIRDRLPNSTLWHAKRFALAQLESLVVVSTGGLYNIDTFDATESDYSPRGDFTILDDLAIRIIHVDGTHERLNAHDVEQVITAANREFETILSVDRHSVVSVFRRITCTIQFDSASDNIDGNARELFGIVADKLGYQLSYLPFSATDVFLPDSDFRNLPESPECAGRAAEFIFDVPLAVDDVTKHIQSAVQSTGSLRPPGIIIGTMSGIEYVQRLQFVGRRY